MNIFGIPYEVQGLFIAGLEIIVGIGGVYFGAIFLTVANLLGEGLKTLDTNVQIFPYSDQYAGNSVEKQREEDAVKRGPIAYAILGDITTVFLALSFVQIFFSSVLIMGICKKSNKLLTSWIIFKAISLWVVFFTFWIFYFVFTEFKIYCGMLILFNLMSIRDIHNLKQSQMKETLLCYINKPTEKKITKEESHQSSKSVDTTKSPKVFTISVKR